MTLTTPAYIDSIRDNITHTWANGDAYVMRPKITAVSGQAFEPFVGDKYTLSWSSQAGSVSSGEINLTTGVLTSGGNTYQLTPTAITAKSGVNNMWADTGDITVEYKAE